MRRAQAQTVYVPATVTGYTDDVVANGAGAVASATTNPCTVRPTATATAQYRAVLTCRLQAASSTAVSVTVLPNVGTLAYTTPPAPAVFCQAGTAAVLTATPAGGRFSILPTVLARLVPNPATSAINLASL